MWTPFPFAHHFFGADPAYPFPEICDLVRAAGYRAIQLSVDRGRPEIVEMARQIREQRARTGLALGAVFTVVDLTNPEPPGALSVPGLIDLLDPGDICEIGLLVGWNKDLSDPKHDDAAARTLAPMLDAAERRGVTLSLYHHDGFWMQRVEDAVRLADSIDHPRLGVSFSAFHWRAVDGEDLLGKLRLCAPRLTMVSVCGCRPREAGGGDQPPLTIEPVGDGDFPLGGFIAALRTVGYEGGVGFLGYRMGGDPVENIRRSLAAWETAVAAG